MVEYKDVLELKPDFAEAHSNLGLLFFKQGDSGSAREHYQRALDVRPDMAEAHYNMGALLEKEGELPQAEARYRETLRWKPGYPEASNARGLVCAKEGKIAEARSCFDREIAINPSFAEATTSWVSSFWAKVKTWPRKPCFGRLYGSSQSMPTQGGSMRRQERTNKRSASTPDSSRS